MQKFVVTVETANASYELPVHAGSLDEALEVAEVEYEELGQVTRVRPDTNFGYARIVIRTHYRDTGCPSFCYKPKEIHHGIR